MIDMEYNLLSKDYISLLLNQIKDLQLESLDSKLKKNTHYNKFRLNINKELKTNLELFLHNKYSKRYLLKDNGMWINKITPDTNKDDSFHVDDSDLTIVTYLNHDYTGGEFEYKNEHDKKIKINTTSGLSLIMNSNIKHRVLPVKSGIRYSFVCFFDILNKHKKTLI